MSKRPEIREGDVICGGTFIGWCEEWIQPDGKPGRTETRGMVLMPDQDIARHSQDRIYNEMKASTP